MCFSVITVFFFEFQQSVVPWRLVLAPLRGEVREPTDFSLSVSRSQLFLCSLTLEVCDTSLPFYHVGKTFSQSVKRFDKTTKFKLSFPIYVSKVYWVVKMRIHISLNFCIQVCFGYVIINMVVINFMGFYLLWFIDT